MHSTPTTVPSTPIGGKSSVVKDHRIVPKPTLYKKVSAALFGVDETEVGNGVVKQNPMARLKLLLVSWTLTRLNPAVFLS